VNAEAGNFIAGTPTSLSLLTPLHVTASSGHELTAQVQTELDKVAYRETLALHGERHRLIHT